MINNIYSTLLKGLPAEGIFTRYVDSAAKKLSYDSSISYILIPEGDREYMSYCADQLAAICNRSPLKAEMLSLDPRNTYWFEFSTVNSTTTLSSPAGYSMQLLEPSLAKEWINRDFPIVVDSTAKTISIPTLSVSASYTWSGSLSNIIDTGEGVQFRIAGADPVTNLSFNMALVRRPYRDIKALPDNLRNSGMARLPEFIDYIDDPDINVSLPALVMNYCKGLQA